MRAIDADELKKCVLKWLPQDPCGKEEKEMPFETDICVSMLMEIDEQPTIQPEPHWIPCSDGLPKEEGFYLVTLEDKCGAETTIRFFRIENGERHWSLWENENITAWMPKPEPMRLENK